jgi:hypothetical protein
MNEYINRYFNVVLKHLELNAKWLPRTSICAVNKFVIRFLALIVR